MKVGYLLRARPEFFRDSTQGMIGIIERIDHDYYGATQAFKRYAEVERGKCIRSDMVDGIGPTKEGIQHRVLVLWTSRSNFATYEKSNTLEVITHVD